MWDNMSIEVERNPKMSTGSFIDDLQDIIDNPTVATNLTPSAKKAKDRPTFPCESCRGTGFYQGVRVHQEKRECFACKGKGYFYQSYADRLKSRNKAAARKASALDVAKDTFNSEHPGVIEGLRALTGWNSFAADLVRQFEERGSLSDKQVAAGISQIEKAAKRDAERAAQKAAEKATAPVVDLANVRAMFEVAKSNGLKKPGLWFGDLKISEAPATGRNAGALYVKQNGEYAGKIDGSTFHPGWGVKQGPIVEALLEIAANPADVLRVKGKQTGKCCCCGRELTDPESVANGIGPICATNWGL